MYVSSRAFCLQALRDALGGGLAGGAVGVVQLRQDLLQRQHFRLAVVREGEFRVDTVSSNRRTNAARPVMLLSSRIFSSGSLR